ncbi:hypothetical protein MMC30_000166 [Trapelia coarctata]|nr:hypothetical protein [Trapelia coarctata]
MPRDEHDFVDYVFSTIPNDVKRYSQEVADYSASLADSVERHFDTVAASIRQTLQQTPWIPESIKPPPTPVRRLPPHVLHLSYLERAQNWVSRNRALTAAIVAFIGTGTIIIWQSRRVQRRKRRARRAVNGARTEVVILAGSPHSPLTRTIALDLERRGFIVYIPVSMLSEEQTIHSELRADIHPLNLDITSPTSTSATLSKFRAHLSHPPSHGSSPHTLRLSSFILLPSYPSTHPTGSITSLNPSTWSDTLNTYLLYPLSLLHAFLPLLLSEPQTPTLLFLTPSLPSALYTATHAPESVTTMALTSYLRTLRAEIPCADMTITTLKLGAFDFGASHPSRTQVATLRSSHLNCNDSNDKDPSTDSKPTSLPSWQGLKSYFSTGPNAVTHEPRRGSPLRELHNGVFDAVVGRRRGTIFLGRGSRAYDFVGSWVPGALVGWMMRRDSVDRVGKWDGEGSGSAEWERVEGLPGESVYR